MGKIIAVNISEEKGTPKKNIHSANLIEDWGVEHDAHAGKWHRQVSLLSYEKIEDFKKKGAPVVDGAFGENLTVQGIDLKTLPIGTRLQCNEVAPYRLLRKIIHLMLFLNASYNKEKAEVTVYGNPAFRNYAPLLSCSIG